MERDAECKGSPWDQPTAPIEYTEAHEPHDEQVAVWADDVAEALLPWLKEFSDYEDKLAFFRALQSQLQDVAVSAHAAGMIRARRQS